MSTPICKICRKEAVKADAGMARSIPYWYCRNCKNELDNYGWSVSNSSGIEELDEYLSGEMGRWDHQYLGTFDPGLGDETVVSVYDPFLKRNRKVPTDHPLASPSRLPAPDPMEPNESDDDEDWHIHAGWYP